jgi:signal transduction histidine kinase
MITVLLVEDSPTDAQLIHQAFLRTGAEYWRIVHVERLCEAIEKALENSTQKQCQFDVVLLDLRLPDSTGLTTVENLCSSVPHIPVVVLTGLNDEKIALQAIEKGAQDYLVKDEINIYSLVRSIRYAIQRGKILNQSREREHISHIALVEEQEIKQGKSQFMAMLFHEFRNPITTIRTSIDLLQSYSTQISEERRTKYLQRMDNAINQMLRLLDEILFLSQDEANKVNFNPKSVNLEDLCSDMVDAIEFGLGNENRIIFTTSGDCSLVRMDEDLLSSIFTNLLSNAVKYSPQKRDVRFNLNCQDGVAIFKIQDQGIGIPQEEQCNLFETFFRASNTNQIPGTGLGLAIVKRCVELHRGDVEVESEVDVGTTVIVTLPLGNVEST